MYIVQLERDKIFDDAIFGVMIARGELFYTLELPWKDNKKNVSCIPEGDYPCVFRVRTPTHENVYEVCDVPDRSGVLIHVGNYPHDVKGCIALGLGRVFEGEGHMLRGSQKAVERLADYMGRKEFVLSIKYHPIEGGAV